MNSPLDKDKNLDDIAQDYVDAVKECNPEPTWDLMQTAVCYGYHYREEEEQKEQKEQKLHLTVSGKEVYKICPRCKSRMIRDDSKVYTSMPPQYGYECPKCGEMEFDTVKYDNPEMEEQKPAEWGDTNELVFKDICKHLKEEGYNGWIVLLEALRNGEFQPKQEWSEEEKQKLNRIYSIIGWAMDEHAFSSCKKLIGDKEGVELQDFLHSIAKPKAEWSDTDNIGWDEAFACVTRAEKAAKNEEELQNAVTAEKWLKEIKFKYCVHPVKQEWSEEDEKTLDCIINVLDRLGFEEYRMSSRDQDVEEERFYYKEIQCLKKLKSLRPQPHWKPSEEQMEALERAVDALKVYTSYIPLISLLEQLKKHT